MNLIKKDGLTIKKFEKQLPGKKIPEASEIGKFVRFVVEKLFIKPCKKPAANKSPAPVRSTILRFSLTPFSTTSSPLINIAPFSPLVITNSFFKWLYSWLHPDLGIRFAQHISLKNKLFSGDEDLKFIGNDNEWLSGG
mgnify:CR=1 FL=1